MTLSTTTHIAPIVDVGTYEGPFSWEHLWEDYADSEREEGNIVCDDYDFHKMGERIVEEANRVFESERPLRKYGVVLIKATKFCSPREYNFMTDWLEIDVEVDDTFWTKAKKAVLSRKNRARIVEYAGDHWVSYDGFSSAMLNRVRTLSRDWWRHEHCGTHMATDKEVGDALVADLKDAFEGLATETSEDEFREFGAILALLWLIEYREDLTRDGGSTWGSWVTEEMLDHLHGNSSLSEFCTVLSKHELDEKLAGVGLVDFDKFRRDTNATYRKYLATGVPDAAKARAKSWFDAVMKDVCEWESRQREIVKGSAPKWDTIEDDVAELRREWEAKLEVGWPGAWK